MNTQDQNNTRISEMSPSGRRSIFERTFGVDSDTVAVGLDRIEEGEDHNSVFPTHGRYERCHLDQVNGRHLVYTCQMKHYFRGWPVDDAPANPKLVRF